MLKHKRGEYLDPRLRCCLTANAGPHRVDADRLKKAVHRWAFRVELGRLPYVLSLPLSIATTPTGKKAPS